MLVPLLLSACQLNDFQSDIAPETMEGTVYGLSQVNSKTLPVTVTDGNLTYQIQQGALTLADTTWMISLVLRQAANGSSQRTVTSQVGAYRKPIPPATAFKLTTGADTATAIFSGTYSTTNVDITDQTALEGLRFLFLR